MGRILTSLANITLQRLAGAGGMPKLCRPCGALPAIVGEDLNTRPVTSGLLDSPAHAGALAPVQQRPRSPASPAAIRTAPEYSNATGYGRPRQTATGHRPAPTTA